MSSIITKSEKETHVFALKMGKNLQGGEVLALSGELGAGKTVFAKGLALGMGYEDNISSPTFVIMKVYDLSNNKKIKCFVHVDTYRINSSDGIKEIGLSEYFKRKDVVTLIEWPENIKEALPLNVINITIENINQNSRKINY